MAGQRSVESLGLGTLTASRIRLSLGTSSLAAAGVMAALCLFYGLRSSGLSSDAASAVTNPDVAWTFRVASAGAYLQAVAWGRGALVAGVVCLSTFPLGRFGGRSLAEAAGLLSWNRGKAAASWTLLLGSLLLGLVALMNYYANASSWAIRWTLDQTIEFLGVIQLNVAVYTPVGPISGMGEIAKWFAILLGVCVLSLFRMRIALGAKRALLDCVTLVLATTFVYEVGIVLLCSNFDFVRVTSLQAGTPFQWFTNVDLLCASLAGVAVLALARRGLLTGAVWKALGQTPRRGRTSG